jgi:hypothetical protein
MTGGAFALPGNINPNPLFIKDYHMLQPNSTATGGGRPEHTPSHRGAQNKLKATAVT